MTWLARAPPPRKNAAPLLQLAVFFQTLTGNDVYTLEKIEKRVEFDLEHIENWSSWLDLYILFRMVPAVILTKEAF